MENERLGGWLRSRTSTVRQQGSYPKRGAPAKEKMTTSSPVTVLMSWCILKTPGVNSRRLSFPGTFPPLFSASWDRDRELATRAFPALVSAARLLLFRPKLSRTEPPNRDQELPRGHDGFPPEMADNGRFCHVLEALVRAVTNQSR